MVRVVENLGEFQSALKEAGNKLVVVDFTATWCGPCKQIAPEFVLYKGSTICLDRKLVAEATFCLAFLTLYKEKAEQKCTFASGLGPNLFGPLATEAEKTGTYKNKLSELPENKDVVFLKVDVDDAEDVSTHCKISCMPTFHFYKNEQKVFEFSGANLATLKSKLEELR